MPPFEISTRIDTYSEATWDKEICESRAKRQVQARALTSKLTITVRHSKQSIYLKDGWAG